MELTRRAVLRGAGALPVIFGLSSVGCFRRPDDDGRVVDPGPVDVPRDKDGNPWYWRSFLDSGKWDEKAHVVLRVPSDPAVAKAFGTLVIDAGARGTLDERLLFIEGTYCFLTDVEIARLVPEAKPSDALVLVDGSARRLDGTALEKEQLVDRAAVMAAIRALVEGPKGFDAEGIAAKRRASVEEDRRLGKVKVEGTIEELAVSSGQVRYLWPLVVLERRTATDPVRRAALDRALESVLHEHIVSSLEMPYGAQLESKGGGCSGAGPNVACGMAMPIPSSYRFIRYLTAKTG